METALDHLMLLLILSDVALLALARLARLTGLVAFQGAALAAMAMLVPQGPLAGRALLLGMTGLLVRGLLFPLLLRRAARQAGITEERNPQVGFAASVLLGIAMLGAAMALGGRMPLHRPDLPSLIVPTALFTILTGVFLIVARRKALTQCLGYLVLENGIFCFGVAAVGEVPALVELGVLLDLFLAVLVMGIAMYRLREEFDHMDTDLLTTLRG
jgi:hydrogenase-4 component E